MGPDIEVVGRIEQSSKYNLFDSKTFFSLQSYKNIVKELYGLILCNKGLDLGSPSDFVKGKPRDLEVVVDFRGTYFSKEPDNKKFGAIEEIMYKLLEHLCSIEGGVNVERKLVGWDTCPRINLLDKRIGFYIFGNHEPKNIVFSFGKNKDFWKTHLASLYEFFKGVEKSFNSFNGDVLQIRSNAVIKYFHKEKEIGGFNLDGGIMEEKEISPLITTLFVN